MRSAFAVVSSRSASARTATARVCVPALPPIEAVIGIKTASATIFCSVSSNSPITAEAMNAVTRLTSSHAARERTMSRNGE